jgi:DNA-binding NarL/FixJ family response regulator
MDLARFLIVDDDATIRRMLARVAVKYGEPIEAATVRDATARVCDCTGQRAWAAFVIDERLPDGSGLALLEHVRIVAPLSRALLIVGAIDADAARAAYDLRAMYLPKPFKTESLRRFFCESASIIPALDRVLGAWQRRYSLSVAGVDILRRTAQGDCRKTIAIARGTSVRTVDAQAAEILRRLANPLADSLDSAVGMLLREVAQIAP